MAAIRNSRRQIYWRSPRPYGWKKITDLQIQSVVEKSIEAGKFPTKTAQTVFTVFLPPGTELIAQEMKVPKMELGDIILAMIAKTERGFITR